MASVGDLPLESGATLYDCRVGYRTFGRLDAARSNAVLIPTWARGTSRELARQIGPSKLVDSSRYFVVAVDTLGNGVSSSPSNSVRQPGASFPVLTVRDLVESQHRLVTRVLGLRRLRAVVGISLGGIQAVAWAALYPDFVDRAVSIAGTPRASVEDRRRWQADIDHLRAGGPPAPEQEDYIRQAHAIASFDLAALFGGSMASAAAALRPRLLVAVSARDEVIEPAASLELARLVRAETVVLDGRCGHAAPSCEKAKLWPLVARFLAE